MHAPYPATNNILLQTLAADDFERLAPHLECVPLEQDQMLAPAGQPIEHVYFPDGGIASIVVIGFNDGRTEVGIFGRDGMSGLPVLLGADSSPQEVFMQVNGTTALRIRTAAFLAAVHDSRTMQALFLRYVQTLLIQSSQSTVANAHDTIETRLARWLLMCHDRVDGDEIRLTHKFMAMMVAAQRTGVTVALHILEGAGIIQSRRARVIVLDRERLEHLAGDTYGPAEREYRRLIGPLGRGGDSGSPLLERARKRA